MNMATAAHHPLHSYPPALTNPEHPGSIAVSWGDMVSHRSFLIRFAQRRLQDPALAEDVVHDVFETVISGRALFAGRAALRSWLTAILRNKIVDLIRQRVSWESLDALSDDESATSPAMAIECTGPRPDELAEHRQTLSKVLSRIADLPRGLREVMEKRVLLDLPSDEVCSLLSISEENLFVRLHRARKQLAS